MVEYQKTSFLTFVAALLFSLSVHAQTKDYTFHTVFAYNFTKYVQWPSDAPEVVIGVVGGEPSILQAFEKMASSKSTAEKKYVIKAVQRPEEAANCHLIFIPEGESGQLSAFAQKFASTPKLLITEKEGLSKKGGLINFITVEGKLRFELNQQALEKAGLKVSQQLLSLAILV